MDFRASKFDNSERRGWGGEGRMPPAPPTLELLWWSDFSSCAYIYKISRGAHVYSCTCKLSVGLFSFGSSLRPVAYSSSSLFCEEPSVCVSRVI